MRTDDKWNEIIEELDEGLSDADAYDELESQITEDDRRWADQQRRLWTIRIEEAKRELGMLDVKPARRIRPEYQVMDRTALKTTLADKLREMGCPRQFRDVSDMSNDGLRRMLEALDEEPEKPS